jgi:hypothetical protein
MPAAADQFTVGQGVRNAMEDADDEPLGNETYFSASYSLTPGRKFAYLYSAEAKQTYKLPKA